ncbi:MAG TPA: hypothetical protein VGD22_13245 [Sphingobacteriaceae bacterium]
MERLKARGTLSARLTGQAGSRRICDGFGLLVVEVEKVEKVERG